jgi:hypothetical protein
MLIGQLGYKGERGDSAYEIAVKHGYTGTEEQWSEDFLNAENYYDKSEVDTLLETKKDTFTFTKTHNELEITFNGTFKRNANVVTLKVEMVLPAGTSTELSFSGIADITADVPDWAKAEDVSLSSYFIGGTNELGGMSFTYNSSQERYKLVYVNHENATTSTGKKRAYTFTYIIG